MFPTTETVTVKALGRRSPQMQGKRIKRVRLLGYEKDVVWKQTADALFITIPKIKNTGKAVCFAVQ